MRVFVYACCGVCVYVSESGPTERSIMLATNVSLIGGTVWRSRHKARTHAKITSEQL